MEDDGVLMTKLAAIIGIIAAVTIAGIGLAILGANFKVIIGGAMLLAGIMIFANVLAEL